MHLNAYKIYLNAYKSQYIPIYPYISAPPGQKCLRTDKLGGGGLGGNLSRTSSR